MQKKNTFVQYLLFYGIPIGMIIVGVKLFFSSLSNIEPLWTFISFVVGFLGLTFILLGEKLLKRCCPNCGGFFCMENVNSTILSKKAITMQEERKVEKYSNYKREYGNYETYKVDVPGVEYTTDVTYCCKKCKTNVIRREVDRYKL